MPELFNSKRAVFANGKQKDFLKRVSKKSSKTFKEIASDIKVSERTVSDWRREKFLISVPVVKRLSRLARIQIPQFKTRGRYDHVKFAGALGGQAIMGKYGSVGGDPEKRRVAWKKWWDNDGRFIKNRMLESKPIKKPSYSVDLAEFAGIMMGDGGISERQIGITLHSINDDQYKDFVVKLIKKLFGVTSGIYKRKDALANTVYVSRTELVKFCTEIMGLPLGHKIKQHLDIPDWIKARKGFQIACLRGLVDTDGSVFTHKYRVDGKIYKYKKMDFCSMSAPLRISVYNIMKDLGLKPRISQHRNVCLDSRKDLKLYFDLVGSSNPKHLKRYKE